jgi:hypothetical protein
MREYKRKHQREPGAAGDEGGGEILVGITHADAALLCHGPSAVTRKVGQIHSRSTSMMTWWMPMQVAGFEVFVCRRV